MAKVQIVIKKWNLDRVSRNDKKGVPIKYKTSVTPKIDNILYLSIKK
jgi:hypothetical protein